jgi:hypothetical protein
LLGKQFKQNGLLIPFDPERSSANSNQSGSRKIVLLNESSVSRPVSYPQLTCAEKRLRSKKFDYKTTEVEKNDYGTHIFGGFGQRKRKND